jgi:F0F1-type ATP synthase delta subunit
VSETAQVEYVFPAALIGRSDLARLVREVESFDNDLEAQKVRSHGTESYSLPTMSRSLNDFIEINKLDMSNDQVRMALKERLRNIKDKAPVIHMTFAVEADPEFLQRLVTWLRQEIHPQTLLSIGMQPSIIAGVYMRTPNHVHDFSIKTLLAGKRDIIVKELEGAPNAG